MQRKLSSLGVLISKYHYYSIQIFLNEPRLNAHNISPVDLRNIISQSTFTHIDAQEAYTFSTTVFAQAVLAASSSSCTRS